MRFAVQIGQKQAYFGRALPYATRLDYIRSRKKKVDFIIPPEAFRPQKAAASQKPSESQKPPEPPKTTEPNTIEKEEVLHKGLTLSSIRVINSFTASKKQGENDGQNLPRNPFSEEVLSAVWETFLQKLKGEGQQNLLSILNMGKPNLTPNYGISICVASESQKKEIIQQQASVLHFIRKGLNNFYINLEVVVDASLNETSNTNTHGYDLYKKLCSINPAVEKFAQVFLLDIRP